MKVLWRRAPLMLLRFPTLLVAVVAVAAITAVTAVAGPAFLASTEAGSLRVGIEQAGPWTAGLSLNYQTLFFDLSVEKKRETLSGLVERLEEPLARRTAEIPQIGEPNLAIVGNEISGATSEAEVRMRLTFRDEAVEHLEVLEAVEGEGVYIPDVSADVMGVVAGDTIALSSATGGTEARVKGIYSYLTTAEPSDFWTPFGPLIYRAPGSQADPPALVFASSRDLVQELAADLDDYFGLFYGWPLVDTEMRLHEARALVQEFEDFSEDLRSPATALGQAQGRDVFRFFRSPETDSALTGVVSTAEERVETVTPVVDLLSVAARLVAFAVLAATGFFLVKRRRVEAAALAARGVGPMAQGARYTVEAILPAALGTVIGAIGGWGLVATLGPADGLPISVLNEAVPGVAVAFAAGMALLFGASAFAARQEERAIAEVPTPLTGVRGLQIAAVTAVAAGAAAMTFGQDISGDSTDALRDPRVTLIPVVLIVAGGIVGATLLRLVLPAIAARLRYRSIPLFLAAKRLAGASAMTQVLVIACACSLGIGIYGLTVSASLQRSAEAKARLFIGGDYSTQVSSTFAKPEDLAFPSTYVTQVDKAPLEDGSQLTLLAIDPEDIADVAYWEESFAEEELETLVGRLRQGSDAGLPVLVSEGVPSDPVLASGSDRVPLDVVGDVSAFPGMPSSGAFVVMSRASFEEAAQQVGRSLITRRDELWLRGEADAITTELLTQDVLFSQPITIDAVLDTPTIQSLLWMLGLLAALGAVAAIISVVGLLLYLQARHRAALVSAALTRRMGLGRGAELGSWAAEIAGALMVALLIALAVGLPVSNLMKDRLDPRPSLPPDPLFIPPTLAMTLLAITLLVTGALAARRVRGAIDRADVAEVMRT